MPRDKIKGQHGNCLIGPQLGHAEPKYRYQYLGIHQPSYLKSEKKSLVMSHTKARDWANGIPVRSALQCFLKNGEHVSKMQANDSGGFFTLTGNPLMPSFQRLRNAWLRH
jgi:hypothetical protein